jgi:hypothetical protein
VLSTDIECNIIILIKTKEISVTFGKSPSPLILYEENKTITPISFWENLTTLQKYGEITLVLLHMGWRETPKTIHVKFEKSPVRF